MIDNPALTLTLDPLSLHRKVLSESLFYDRYISHCTDKLATCIPPPLAQSPSTRQASFAHNYCAEVSNAKINWFSDGFFPSASHLWNSLASSVFRLPSISLPSEGRSVIFPSASHFSPVNRGFDPSLIANVLTHTFFESLHSQEPHPKSLPKTILWNPLFWGDNPFSEGTSPHIYCFFSKMVHDTGKRYKEQ